MDLASHELAADLAAEAVLELGLPQKTGWFMMEIPFQMDDLGVHPS